MTSFLSLFIGGVVALGALHIGFAGCGYETSFRLEDFRRGVEI